METFDYKPTLETVGHRFAVSQWLLGMSSKLPTVGRLVRPFQPMNRGDNWPKSMANFLSSQVYDGPNQTQGDS